jgi:hypothetical protein
MALARFSRSRAISMSRPPGDEVVGHRVHRVAQPGDHDAQRGAEGSDGVGVTDRSGGDYRQRVAAGRYLSPHIEVVAHAEGALGDRVRSAVSRDRLLVCSGSTLTICVL